MTGTPTVFIQVWVDTNKVLNGSSEGIYLVDNRVGNGSRNEGSTGLLTNVTNGSVIQWDIYNIDATGKTALAITAIGNASIWGAGGQPQSNGAGGFVGQAQVTGQSAYQITMNVQKQPGSAGITINVDPSMIVQ